MVFCAGKDPRMLAARVVPVLRSALLFGGRRLLVGGIASQPERSQPRSLFPHRMHFGLVLGHCLLAITQLLLLFEQRFGATLRLIGLHAQYRNSLVKSPREDHRPLDPKPSVFWGDQTGSLPGQSLYAGKFVCE